MKYYTKQKPVIVTVVYASGRKEGYTVDGMKKANELADTFRKLSTVTNVIVGDIR